VTDRLIPDGEIVIRLFGGQAAPRKIHLLQDPTAGLAMTSSNERIRIVLTIWKGAMTLSNEQRLYFAYLHKYTNRDSILFA